MVSQNRLYSRYVICYDIENVKTRKKLYKSFKDFGLTPIQKSVFFGELTRAEIASIKRIVNELLNKKTDKCLYILNSLTEQDIRNNCFGYKDFKYVSVDGFETI
ncbi:MAG: CRISPR-associated endonuclease Cas2 [Succinatimonas sp.]|nr:CRISPR-associated endonuclease Cas2 [Succinatimonas sp.]